MKTKNEYELKYWKMDKLVVGIDEAGRGPLAGPVVVAGVIFNKGYDTGEINDSKQLSEKKREELFTKIKENAYWYDIEVIDSKTIDEMNILEATRMGFERIASKAPCEIVLTDAMKLRHTDKEVIDLIKGDTLSGSIAAGSILAKVSRDHIMYEYDKQYPKYGFKDHKGYGTKKHLEALEKYGPLEIHRRSFRPVIEASQEKLF